MDRAVFRDSVLTVFFTVISNHCVSLSASVVPVFVGRL